MTKLTITKAQANPSALLEKATRGEDIGIVSGDQIVALRPVGTTTKLRCSCAPFESGRRLLNRATVLLMACRSEIARKPALPVD